MPAISVQVSASAVDRLAEAAPAMDRRNYDRLRRGKLPVERRIDLHGMSLAAAHVALQQFLLSAHRERVRVVLVITGKGRAQEDGMVPAKGGVIRRAFPDWLSLPPLAGLVVQAVPAARHHGGAGAFYVYLRRNR